MAVLVRLDKVILVQEVRLLVDQAAAAVVLVLHLVVVQVATVLHG
jgi:hypothetical protein